MIKIGIIDDEENARRVIRKYLERYTKENFNIVFEASSFDSTIDLTFKTKPDILFLDIHLLDGSGIEIVKILNEKSYHPTIIFTTAYDQYAISALKLKVFDYLLKPIDNEEFNETLEKVIEHVKNQTASNLIKSKIAIRTLYETQLIETKNIVFIKAESSYCTIHTHDNKSITISKPLKYLENELSNDALFLKIHKSFIINVNYVQSLDRILNHVILSDGNRLPISRNNIKLVFNYFNN